VGKRRRLLIIHHLFLIVSSLSLCQIAIRDSARFGFTFLFSVLTEAFVPVAISLKVNFISILNLLNNTQQEYELRHQEINYTSLHN